MCRTRMLKLFLTYSSIDDMFLDQKKVQSCLLIVKCLDKYYMPFRRMHKVLFFLDQGFFVRFDFTEMWICRRLFCMTFETTHE